MKFDFTVYYSTNLSLETSVLTTDIYFVFQETDMVVAALTMTSEREEVIDFVAPYFEQSGILIGKKFLFKTLLCYTILFCVMYRHYVLYYHVYYYYT